ncbi:MAG: hypothetical protein ACHQKY_15555 [Terriglobia bacterium]
MRRIPGEPFIKIGWVELKSMDLVFLVVLAAYLGVTVWLALGLLNPK